MSVVKNVYDVAPFARALQGHVDYFGVASWVDAKRVRDAAPGTPVALLYPTEPNRTLEAVAADIDLPVPSIAWLDAAVSELQRAHGPFTVKTLPRGWCLGYGCERMKFIQPVGRLSNKTRVVYLSGECASRIGSFATRISPVGVDAQTSHSLGPVLLNHGGCGVVVKIPDGVTIQNGQALKVFVSTKWRANTIHFFQAMHQLHCHQRCAPTVPRTGSPSNKCKAALKAASLLLIGTRTYCSEGIPIEGDKGCGALIERRK